MRGYLRLVSASAAAMAIAELTVSVAGSPLKRPGSAILDDSMESASLEAEGGVKKIRFVKRINVSGVGMRPPNVRTRSVRDVQSALPHETPSSPAAQEQPVKKILGRRQGPMGKLQYRVRYTESWVDRDRLSYAEGAIRHFEARRKLEERSVYKNRRSGNSGMSVTQVLNILSRSS